jgi:hypothetical protein
MCWRRYFQGGTFFLTEGWEIADFLATIEKERIFWG